MFLIEFICYLFQQLKVNMTPKWSIKLMILFIIVILLLNNKSNLKLYVLSIKHYKYFIWMYHKGFCGSWVYKCKLSVFVLAFTFIYPLVSLIPDWERRIGFNGEIIILPISLHRDNANYDICKRMNDKYEWFKMLEKHNIPTPDVYYVNLSQIKTTPNRTHFVMKPIYGTQGTNIEICTKEEYLEKISTKADVYILQEYIQDCFTPDTRHFRIMTSCIHNETYVFFINEYKQNSEYVSSNKANGGIKRTCTDVVCDFLTDTENDQLSFISKRLIFLHNKELSIIPFIGWDVSLSCNGPYVFEGNLGASINKERYAEYSRHIWNLYDEVSC